MVHISDRDSSLESSRTALPMGWSKGTWDQYGVHLSAVSRIRPGTGFSSVFLAHKVFGFPETKAKLPAEFKPDPGSAVILDQSSDVKSRLLLVNSSCRSQCTLKGMIGVAPMVPRLFFLLSSPALTWQSWWTDASSWTTVWSVKSSGLQPTACVPCAL